MALQQDKLFIEKDAFDSYRDVSDHLEDDRANAAIRETQTVDLIDVIGAGLYRVLQTDFVVPARTWTTAKYEALFNGDVYTPRGQTNEVIYHGIQPMLTYYAYARLLSTIQLAVARSGPVTYMEEDTSQPTTQAQIKTKVIDARAMADRYKEEVIAYLNTKSTDYAEWRNTYVDKPPFQLFKI